MDTHKILLTFFALGLFSCSKTALMRVQVLEPGGITVPAHIKTIAVVNRSHPPKPEKKAVIGVFTGENVLRNKEAAQQVLAGLNEQLRATGRFEVKLINVEMIGSQHGGILPPPLDAKMVAKICRDYQADAVIALEDYSANCAHTTAEKIVTLADRTVRNGIGGVLQTVTSPRYSATQVAVIKLGFRMYDAHTSLVGDQFSFAWTNRWTTDAANNASDVIAGAMNDNMAIAKASYVAGMNYGRRIAPSWQWVHRMYYRRSKNYDMGVAARLAITGNWSGAVEVWKDCEKKLSRKKAGRAAYNLALAYEVLGDLDQAQQWCEKSYVVYRNKRAREYSQVLKQRVWEMNKLQQQLDAK